MTRIATLVAAVALAATGCDLDYLPDVGEPLAGSCEGADSIPALDVSFARDVRPMFDRARAMAGCSCHTPTNGSPSGIELGGFDMGSIHSIMRGGRSSGPRIVTPGDPCSSVLMHKIGDTPPFGARMPLDGPPYLTAEEIQLVHDWIAEGAQDN